MAAFENKKGEVESCNSIKRTEQAELNDQKSAILQNQKIADLLPGSMLLTNCPISIVTWDFARSVIARNCDLTNMTVKLGHMVGLQILRTQPFCFVYVSCRTLTKKIKIIRSKSYKWKIYGNTVARNRRIGQIKFLQFSAPSNFIQNEWSVQNSKWYPNWIYTSVSFQMGLKFKRKIPCTLFNIFWTKIAWHLRLVTYEKR